MPYMDKNSLGAGDATCITKSSKKRLPVPSSRRFATRGVVSNPDLQEKLKEALDDYTSFKTPPETPVKKRSQSIAEITPSKRRSVNPQKTYNETARTSAARKVTTTLLLNAWRCSRKNLAASLQSSDYLKSNLEQCKIQVEVLQKLRESESQKRNGALSENTSLLKQLESYKGKCRNLEETMGDLSKREQDLLKEKEKLQIDLLKNENVIKVLTNQNALCQQAYEAEKQELQSAKTQNKSLLLNMEELKLQVKKEAKERKDLCDLLKMSESKYEECAGSLSGLLQDYDDLNKRLAGMARENEEYESILQGATYKAEKQEAKISELKKMIAINKTQRKQLEEDLDLKMKVLLEYEERMNQQLGKRWWKSSGEFIIKSLQSLAYIIFPALQVGDLQEDCWRNITIENSIALGSL